MLFLFWSLSVEADFQGEAAIGVDTEAGPPRGEERAPPAGEGTLQEGGGGGHEGEQRFADTAVGSQVRNGQKFNPRITH